LPEDEQTSKHGGGQCNFRVQGEQIKKFVEKEKMNEKNEKEKSMRKNICIRKKEKRGEYVRK
jgi:hypothetical protein